MKIVPSQLPLKSNLKDKNTSYFNKTTLIIYIFSILFFVGLSTYSIQKYFPDGIYKGIGKFAMARGFNYFNKDKSTANILKAIVKTPKRIIANSEEIPKIYIDIKFKYLQKIHAKRNEALSEGALVQGSNDFVPAIIRSNNNEIKIKLRLKGDWLGHLEGKKWSFRIHTKGKSHLFGLRRFSIQHPKARGFQGATLINEVFNQFNILTPRYSFIDVVINGDNIGIMALEEHFSKELLERSGRKEGVILRFDESLLWDAKDGGGRGFGGVFDSYLNVPIDAFQSSKIKKSEHLSREYATAVGLLRGITNDHLIASEVFDHELMGSYLAIAQFFGTWHEIKWHNQRFYLNPLTLKLEPISFDADIHDPSPIGSNIIGTGTEDNFNRNLLKDKKIYSSFKKTLKILKENTLNGKLIKTLQDVEQPLLRILNKEFFFLDHFDYKELRERALNVPKINTANIINIDATVFPQYIHAFLIENNERQYLELLNALPYEVEVQAITWIDKAGNRKSFNTIKPHKYPFILEKTSLKKRPESFYIEYSSPSEEGKFKLEVISNIKGDPTLKATKAQKYFQALKYSPLPKGNIDKLLSGKPYLTLEDENTIVIKEGHWHVKGNIIIPKGYNLKIIGNTQLQFEQDGCVVIYGSSSFKGTSDKPIILKGIDNKPWQGLVVFQANDRSKWSHVTILNTTGINFPLWKLTGGTTFYQSDVDIENGLFSGNKGEDALNIIHSDFTFDKVDIINTQSDGFDGDFVTGSISGGLFQDIGRAGGGDGVDISGSNVSLVGTFFNRVNDKAISVGENSTMSVFNATINNVSIGAASKDKSSLKINNTQISNAQNVALMAYVKKPEYGSASLIAKQTQIIDSNKSTIVQQGSYLELNGIAIASEELNVKQLYKTIMKPGVKK